jgi:hypothetical protein
MIHIKRYHEAPECLDKKQNYKCGEVVDLLEEEFMGKCYLCETDQFSVNVEHFIPHKRNKKLKFDWNNLFYACEHCNNLKGETQILDCTNPAHDVENRIYYNAAYFPWHRVHIEAADYPEHQKEAPEEALFGDEAVRQADEAYEEALQNLTGNTVELLNRIYNGSSVIKTKGAAKLKQYLIQEMIRFQDLLLKYERNKYNPHYQEQTEAEIAAELDRGSKLTAFKRQIIKDYPALREKFEKYFN